jgi:hypothetical protein
MFNGAVNNSEKQRGKPFKPGTSGNPRGRPRGARNKRSIADQEVAASGMSPLAFLCSVFRNPKQPMKRRIEAAKSAAPYMHARLAATLLLPPQEQLGDNRIELVFVPGPGVAPAQLEDRSRLSPPRSE